MVECTDSMETPIESLAVGVASLGAVGLFAAAAAPQDAFDSGAVFWAPLLGTLGVAALGECRDAKQRGAVVAEVGTPQGRRSGRGSRRRS